MAFFEVKEVNEILTREICILVMFVLKFIKLKKKKISVCNPISNRFMLLLNASQTETLLFKADERLFRQRYYKDNMNSTVFFHFVLNEQRIFL